MQVLIYCELGLKTPIHAPKIDFFFGGGVSEWCDVDPNELVLTFGSCYLCATFGENRSRNATVRVLTDRRTHTLTETNWIYNLSHAICSSYRADYLIQSPSTTIMFHSYVARQNTKYIAFGKIATILSSITLPNANQFLKKINQRT